MNSYKGGFVGSNSGSIADCYSLLGVDGKKAGVTGFCGQNSGSIRQSFHSGRLGHMDAGFGVGGERDNCFYFTGRGEAKKAEKLPDHPLWREDADIKSAKDARELGFDEKTWSYTGDRQVLSFNEDTWYYKPGPLPPLPADGPLAGKTREKISIDSAEALADFAKRVNGGDLSARNAEVTLTENLDLGGRDWTPVGLDKARSFRGFFDGRGHRISNFRINGKDLRYRGFFGVLEGGVCNLTVDCAVKGGGVVGTLAGQLLGGEIRCCGAVTELRPNRKAEAVGGLVGVSTGEIVLSYAAGRMRFFPILLLPLLGVPLLALLVALVLLLNPVEQPVNAPVPTDPTQLEIPAADLPDLPKASDPEKHTMTFNVTTEATASLASGKVSLWYQNSNPNSDMKVIVQLRLSTGVVIAETGAVMPGSMITEMTLTDRAWVELTPGRYTATIHMVPYSTEDESKGFIETEVPITLTVE